MPPAATIHSGQNELHKAAGTHTMTTDATVAAASAKPSSSPITISTSTTMSGKSKGKVIHHDKQSLDYIIRSGLAGGTAGCAAKTLIAPLDRVKILFQASNPQFAKYTGSWFGVVRAIKDINTHEGFSGLFRGHSVTLLRIFPYAAIKFVVYEQIRSVLIPTKQHETPIRRFMSGSLAGVTSVFFTYPLEVMRVRLAFETRREQQNGLWTLFKRIYSEGPGSRNFGAVATKESPGLIAGLSNFYRGFSPTVLGMLPYAGVSFLMHDLAGDWFRSKYMAPYTVKAVPDDGLGYDSSRKVVLKVWAQLAAGGIAGAMGQTASYPLEVIRRRMQVGGVVGEGKFLSIKETAATILKESGVRGFFVGLTIGYIKVVPMVATSFFVYERSKLYLGI